MRSPETTPTGPEFASEFIRANARLSPPTGSSAAVSPRVPAPPVAAGLRRIGAPFDRMSVDVEHPPSGLDPTAPIPFKPPRRRRRRRHPDRPPKPRVRKLRLLAILVGLGTLAFISTVFGMMMA